MHLRFWFRLPRRCCTATECCSTILHPQPIVPPQVLHRDRVLFNVRNGWDVAKFLSEPQK